jgi:2-keto-3-deoxy-L-rhamnonate aldolase RhmA
MARLDTLAKQALLRKSLAGSAGTFIGIPSQIPYELAALAGFDWVISDLEHGENEFSTLPLAIAGFGGPVIARVPALDPSHISRALDRGVAGLMLPKVDNLESLEAALAATMYPPTGTRGVAGYNRAAGWGSSPEYLVESNPVVLVQIESPWAVANCDLILSNELVDGIFVGPLDLSYSLGTPRNFDSDVFGEALTSSIAAAKRANKPIGILATKLEQISTYRGQGFDFLAFGSDTTSLLSAFQGAVLELKRD